MPTVAEADKQTGAPLHNVIYMGRERHGLVENYTQVLDSGEPAIVAPMNLTLMGGGIWSF